MLAAAFSVNAFAHTPFTLVSSEKKSLTANELAGIEKLQTVGVKERSGLSFSEKEVRLVIETGPEEDMLSYRIQGVRNPILVLPSGATLRILFVNFDSDMRHDIRFGHIMGDIPIAPDVTDTAGSTKLPAKSADGTMQAEEIVLKANDDGEYKYFCSVRGHAKGGMWGNILIGVKPGSDLKIAPKTTHIHTPDEDKMPADMKDMPKTNKPGDVSDMPGMSGMDHRHGVMEMRSTVNIGEPMSREGSGTSWLPDASPVHAYMKMYKDGGMLMLHGSMFFRYTAIGSSRDVSTAGKGSRSRFDAPSMFMAMYSRPLTKRSQLGLRAMVSLDPIIERGYGYPLLYQSGEAFHGQPLHDRQHPHDFFSELAATYSYKFDEKNSVFVYAGYPGEPALGPVAFMHRPSAANNPDAPIGHHWQDATHITFGVITAGFTHNKFKIEASAFKGREPDENRWNFDPPKLNSFGGRVSFNPTKQLAFQYSYGYLKEPEPAEPEIRILRRMTASVIYNKVFGDDRNWANTLVWGQNHTNGSRTNSYLFESNYEFSRNNIFGRMEAVQKTAHDLALPSPHPEGNFWLGSYSIGYLRDVIKDKGIDAGIGTMATLNTNPKILNGFYGGSKHAGWQIFIRLRPSRAK